MKRQIDFDNDMVDVRVWLFGESHAASAEMKEKLRELWMAYYETKARSETLTEILVAASAKSLDIRVQDPDQPQRRI